MGFVGGPVFFRFQTFYPYADKNSIVSVSLEGSMISSR